MPTTGEFGPQGGFDDWDYHENVATRFGASGVTSLEDSFSDQVSNTPENTTLRLTDSLNLFDTGTLAPGVTVKNARFSLLSLDAGLKYRGIFVGAAYFQRWLTDLHADGMIPMSSIVDRGFYIQAAFYPVKHVLEAYGATSWVFGDTGFPTQHEYLGGANWFFVEDTNVGGLRGPIAAVAVSINF